MDQEITPEIQRELLNKMCLDFETNISSMTDIKSAEEILGTKHNSSYKTPLCEYKLMIKDNHIEFVGNPTWDMTISKASLFLKDMANASCSKIGYKDDEGDHIIYLCDESPDLRKNLINDEEYRFSILNKCNQIYILTSGKMESYIYKKEDKYVGEVKENHIYDLNDINHDIKLKYHLRLIYLNDEQIKMRWC